MVPQSSDNDIWVSLSDFKLICKRIKKKIFWGAGIVSCLAILYVLLKPIEYYSTAAFREKGNNNGGVPTTSLTTMLLGGGSGRSGNHSEAISTMKSRNMISHLIEELNLQGSISPRETHYQDLSNVRDNLIIELALFNKKQGPIFKDEWPAISLKHISYAGEAPFGARVVFINDTDFDVHFSRQKDPIRGHIGTPISLEGASFTIERNPSQELSHNEYNLTIIPLNDAVDNVLARIQIDTDRDDKTLIKLKYRDTNRYRAAAVLNGLMSIYQRYLKDEQTRVSNEQLAYLQGRQEEMQARLRKMMDEHAAVLAADMTHLGFPDATAAMNFFAAIQQQHMQQQLNIDLELKRLEELQGNKGAAYEKILPTNDPSGMSTIVNRIRNLKQQADGIELALGNDWSDSSEIADSQDSLHNLFEKLREVKTLTDEVVYLSTVVENGQLPDLDGTILKDPKYKVRSWCERLQATQDNSRERVICKNHFLTYLDNLSHIFQVYNHVIEERLTHLRDIQREFQGIDLDIARELYLNYSKELNALEAESQQKRFIVAHLEEPTFEVSSLSAVLKDPVSERIIAVASPLVLSLKDQNNRSQKEQDRLRNELEVHKGFLSDHLNQMVQLLELREKLLKEKIQALQAATLGLIQQEVSILENHLAEQISGRVDQLVQERRVVEDHQSSLQEMASKLPEKWVLEKLIAQQMEMNGRMVEEITKLVESKNTSSKLELIQSAPVDEAQPPVKPKPPKTLFYAIFGAILGGLTVSGFGIVKAIATGMPATEENLKLAGHKVAGRLSDSIQRDMAKPLMDLDLETLRRLSFILSSNVSKAVHGQAVACILGPEGINYTPHLASLFAKKGKKTLILPLFFDEPSEQQGILQYLEGRTITPKIVHHESYDTMHSGGISRFALELFDGEKFRDLLKSVGSNYDWIFVVTKANCFSAEACHLIHTCNQSVVSIAEETWEQLRPVFKAAEGSSSHNLAFLFKADSSKA